ncbi:ParA family protein [Acidianus brierleyi]|uniref:AAA domain-containing protein n=1 Tax=Acidianus brierleyi TaxID=41673 RepID=A0A2U9IC61_9CREN|nr:ParA family protein [Acidianus brierleyi]AWR93606.1 AAA family ATPase [Acidianus brierleyi]
MRITVYGVKGGIGKSTICLTLGKTLARKGKKVLIIDRDPLGWSSNVIGIKDKGLINSIIDNISANFFKSVKIENGYLDVIKFYGDPSRVFNDSYILTRNREAKKKFEEIYSNILHTNKYDFYIVDNFAMVNYNNDIVFHEREVFYRILPNIESYRIYVSDHSATTLKNTENYIEKIEKSTNIGKPLGLTVNMVPPYPKDLEDIRIEVEKILQRKKLGIGIIIPFIEKLFGFSGTLNELDIPNQIDKLSDNIIKGFLTGYTIT